MHAITVRDLVEFDSGKRIKKRVVLTENLVTELLCYEPGQGTVTHHHVREDEAFYVIEGRGTITVDGVVHAVGPTDLVFAPSPLDHALQAAADSRFVVIYFRAPGRKSARPGIVATVGQPAGAED